MEQLLNEYMMEYTIETTRSMNDIIIANESMYVESCYMKSGDGESFFDAVIRKLRAMLASIRTTVTKFTSSFATKNIKESDVNGKTAEIKDYEKLSVNETESLKRVEAARSEAEVEEAMKKYRSQRNKLIAGGALVTASLTGLLVYVTKKSKSNLDKVTSMYNAKCSELEREKVRYKHRTEQAKNLALKNKSLQNENERLKATGPDKIKVVARQAKENISDRAESAGIARAKLNASTEILKDAGNTVVSNIKDAVSALTSHANPVKKAVETTKSVGGVVGAVKDVATGKTKDKVFADKAAELKREILEKSARLDKVMDKVNAMAAGEKKKEYEKRIKKEQEQIKKMKKTYMSFKSK